MTWYLFRLSIFKFLTGKGAIPKLQHQHLLVLEEMWISDPAPALLNDNLHFNKRPRWFLGTLRAKRCWTRTCLGETDQVCRPALTMQMLPSCGDVLSLLPFIVSVFLLCRVWFLVTQWTAVHQVPLSMEYSRQEYWNEVPFPTPGDLPDSGIKPVSLTSSALAHRFFTNCTGWEALSVSESCLLLYWAVGAYACNLLEIWNEGRDVFLEMSNIYITL